MLNDWQQSQLPCKWWLGKCDGQRYIYKIIDFTIIINCIHHNYYTEVRASRLAQASERVGSPIPALQQG